MFCIVFCLLLNIFIIYKYYIFLPFKSSPLYLYLCIICCCKTKYKKKPSLSTFPLSVLLLCQSSIFTEIWLEILFEIWKLFNRKHPPGRVHVLDVDFFVSFHKKLSLTQFLTESPLKGPIILFVEGLSKAFLFRTFVLC